MEVDSSDHSANNRVSVDIYSNTLLEKMHSPPREYQTKDMQTEMDHPDTPLKDIGYSGVVGGSSSVLSRKDIDTSSIYVPLKKRIIEKSFSSSKLLNESSYIDSKQI